MVRLYLTRVLLPVRTLVALDLPQQGALQTLHRHALLFLGGFQCCEYQSQFFFLSVSVSVIICILSVSVLSEKASVSVSVSVSISISISISICSFICICICLSSISINIRPVLVIISTSSLFQSLLQVVYGVRLVLTGDDLLHNENALIVLNHPTRYDSMIVW